MRILFIIFLLFSSCSSQENNTLSSPESERTVTENDNFTATPFYTDSIGWGYEIKENGKVVIIQKHIPAIQGMNGFKTEEDAQRVGNLIVQKLNNNIFPPTIQVEELEQLGIEY